MDEHREEALELEAIQRDDTDDARQCEAERIEWTTHDGLSWAEYVTAETEAWSR